MRAPVGVKPGFASPDAGEPLLEAPARVAGCPGPSLLSADSQPARRLQLDSGVEDGDERIEVLGHEGRVEGLDSLGLLGH